MSHDERRIAVQDGKYTFFVPEGDYRAHCLRYGEEWHVFEQGCNAVIALMSELLDARELVGAILKWHSEGAPYSLPVLYAAIDRYREIRGLK